MPSSTGTVSSGSSPAGAGPSGPAAAAGKATRLSYKFQRLREKIRRAVESGELSGKLPGERALAKRFHVNAKTLSKALTDLAAEGLLDRSIGRGTYVKGSAPAAPVEGRWLLLCDAADADSPLVRMLAAANPDTHVASLGASDPVRPSFLNQFSAVIDLAATTPDALLREFVVRSLPLVAVGREPRTYSTSCVVVDAALGAARLGRDLMLAGHRRLAVVEPAAGDAPLARGLRQAAVRCAPDATVDACAASAADVRTMIEHGVTAFVCDCPASAAAVRRELDRLGANVPGQVSLAVAAAACDAADAPCSGYFVPCRQMADAVVSLLRDTAASARPAAVWLVGEFVDRGTTAPAPSVGAGVDAEPAPPYRAPGRVLA